MSKDYYELARSINDLEDLKLRADFIEAKIAGYQNNSNLITILNDEYPKLSVSAKNQILALTKGKKTLTEAANAARAKIEEQFIGTCFKAGINPLDQNRNLLEFKKLSSKITKKLHYLSKEQDHLSEKQRRLLEENQKSNILDLFLSYRPNKK